MSYSVYPCKQDGQQQYVILSSGLGGHASFWQPQIEALQQHFHVLTYDQEGCHADSALLPAPYSMTHMAQQVLDLIEQEQIEEIHFIGHALGGHIGAELARLLATKGKTLLSLTSINAWDELDPHTEKCFETRLNLLQHAGAEAYIKAQALFLYPPAWISRNIQVLKEIEAKQLPDFPPHHNVLQRISALKAFRIDHAHIEALQATRIHLIANHDDFLVPYHKSQDLYRKLGHGELSFLPEGAHASTVTQASLVNGLLINFLLKQ